MSQWIYKLLNMLQEEALHPFVKGEIFRYLQNFINQNYSLSPAMLQYLANVAKVHLENPMSPLPPKQSSSTIPPGAPIGCGSFHDHD
jgi:hypothetical protein